MIAVTVAEQHHVHIAQPRIVGSGERVTDIVKNANARWIFEERGAVVRAKLSRMRAQRRDFHVLRERRSHRKSACETRCRADQCSSHRESSPQSSFDQSSLTFAAWAIFV